MTTYQQPPRVRQLWVRKDETIHPFREMDSPSRGAVSQFLGFWFLNSSACQVCLNCIALFIMSYLTHALHFV
jgi:hypothetical protein